MKTVYDCNIAAELKNGHQLILNSYHGKLNGVIVLQPHPYLITQCEEVDLGNIENQIPNIQNKLQEPSHICRITYDLNELLFKGEILKSETEGCYCETKDWKLVDDLFVYDREVLPTLTNLESKIALYEHSDFKQLKKVK